MSTQEQWQKQFSANAKKHEFLSVFAELAGDEKASLVRKTKIRLKDSGNKLLAGIADLGMKHKLFEKELAETMRLEIVKSNDWGNA